MQSWSNPPRVSPGLVTAFILATIASGSISCSSTDDASPTSSNAPPVAVLDGPLSKAPGVPVQFDASASNDPDGHIVQYAFNFGDGTPVVSQSGATAWHTFAASGAFTASLTVTDDRDATATATHRIIIGLAVSSPVNVSWTPTHSQSYSVSRDPAGNLDVVWEERGNDIMFSRSGDAGRTFAAPIYVVDPNGFLGSANGYSSGGMDVAASPGAIHVAWTLYDTYTGGAEVFYARSVNGGATFGAVQMVSTADASNSYGPSIAVDDAGTVAIVWGEASPGVDAVSYSRALRGSTSFSTPLVLSTSLAGCPAVALSSSNHYVAWAAGPYGQEQIWFSRSTDDGLSFSVPIALNHPTRTWCPQVDVDPAGIVYVGWEEGEAFTERTILLATSSDLGTTFTEPVVLSDPTADSTCLSLTADSAHLFVAWTTLLDGVLRDSWLVASPDGGVTFGAPLLIPRYGTSGCYSLVPYGAESVGLVWSGLMGAVPGPDPGFSVPDIFFRVATLPTQ